MDRDVAIRVLRALDDRVPIHREWTKVERKTFSQLQRGGYVKPVPEQRVIGGETFEIIAFRPTDKVKWKKDG